MKSILASIIDKGIKKMSTWLLAVFCITSTQIFFVGEIAAVRERAMGLLLFLFFLLDPFA